VPRFNNQLGIPLTYRLEPGSNWISSADRRFPNPPRIPLLLPAGELFVQVHKPDDTIDTLEAPIVQSSARSPTLPGGTYTNFGTGHSTDIYHVTTLDDGFNYAFDQDGHHVITVEGHVEDIYGNIYPIGGTYDVTVANILDLDPGQLPTTPYEVGNAFSPGLHVFPPCPAEVTVELVHMPYSEPGLATTTTIVGSANRFGYFQPPAGTVITFTTPGEFRVDYTAVFTDPDGGLWMGTMTYGNVVETPSSQIIAHGRRGMDYHGDVVPTNSWFEVLNLPTAEVGIEVYYPYFSGDVHWGDQSRQPGDSIHTIISIEDRDGYDGLIYNLLRAQWPSRSGFRWPPDAQTLAGLNQRLAINEAPLYITTDSGLDPGVDPAHIDLWGYWYGSSERPDVHVRETISEDDMGTAYWRFDDTYGYQIGEGAKGDLPGDIKWEFGGAVLRYIATPEPIIEYSIYSSLWVLLPDNDPRGARITPPFQDGIPGVSINGGPIMTIGDTEIDVLFLPKGVRPGDILHLGDTISFSGHVGPPLNSLVSVTITPPEGPPIVTADLRANKIGWVYDPDLDFPADVAGRWTVDVHVVHDQPLVYASAPISCNTGTVLGTSGQYEFYVVEPSSPRLSIASPEEGPIIWPAGEIEPIVILGYAPPGTTVVHYTIHDKGVVMVQGVAFPDDGGAFEIVYDAEALNGTFPFVSLTSHEGEWEGLADELTINMLGVGTDQPRAANVTLIGEEIFVSNDIRPAIYLPLVLRNYTQ
jgi:hypothetical protein